MVVHRIFYRRSSQNIRRPVDDLATLEDFIFIAYKACLPPLSVGMHRYELTPCLMLGFCNYYFTHMFKFRLMAIS